MQMSSNSKSKSESKLNQNNEQPSNQVVIRLLLNAIFCEQTIQHSLIEA